MLKSQFSGIPVKDRIATTEGDIQRRKRLGMSESNPEMKALRVFLQNLYAERNKGNRQDSVKQALYPIAPPTTRQRPVVASTKASKSYRVKAGGKSYNVLFAQEPNDADLDRARQKYLTQDNPAAVALIKRLQQEIKGLGEEAPERYQGLVDRIDWVRKEGTTPMPSDWKSKQELKEPLHKENLFDVFGVNGNQPRVGNTKYEQLRNTVYGQPVKLDPLTLLASKGSSDNARVEKIERDRLKANPVRQMAIKTRFGTFSVPHRGQLDKETYAGFQYLLTKEAKRRGMLVVNTHEPDMGDVPPPPSITKLMVDIVKKSPLGQLEEKASLLPHVKWARDFGKELTDYSTSDDSEAGTNSQKFIAGLVGGSLDSTARPIESTTHDLANFVYDNDAPLWERALSGVSVASNFMPAGQTVGVGIKAAKGTAEGVKVSVKAAKFARAAATHALKNSVPIDKIKHALEHGAVTWNLGKEIYQGGGGLKDILDETSGSLSGFRKTKAHVDEEKLGLGLDPARSRYHSHLDLTVRNGLLSAQAARNLKIMHDLRAHKWSKKTNRKFSEYYAEHAPKLGDRMERHAERGKVRGQVLSTRLPGKIHDTSELHIADLDALKASPDYAWKVAEALGEVPGMKHIFKKDKDVNLMLDEYAHFMADNLVWLHDQTPEEIRKLVRQTFEGANKLATRLAVRHGLKLENVAGAMAALTAGTKWEHTVTNLDRLMDVMSKGKTYKMDAKMEKWLHQKFNEGKIKPEEFARIRGKSLGELSSADDKALWVRAYDRFNHGAGYRSVDTRGRYGEFILRKDGQKAGRRWNDEDALKKAIESLEGKSIEAISPQLGKSQKVRNIYNNIADPYGRHPFLATDLHMVSGSLGQAVSGRNQFARNAYGDGNELDKQALAGIRGTNPVYLEAAKIAAKKLGITNPHEIQSIAWHMSKALFSPALKRSKKKEHIEKIWSKVDRGIISSNTARKRVKRIANGFDDMVWLKPGTTRNRSSYN